MFEFLQRLTLHVCTGGTGGAFKQLDAGMPSRPTRERPRRYNPSQSLDTPDSLSEPYFKAYSRYLQKQTHLKSLLVGGGVIKVKNESKHQKLGWVVGDIGVLDEGERWRRERRQAWCGKRLRGERVWKERVRKEEEERVKRRKVEEERRRREEEERRKKQVEEEEARKEKVRKGEERKREVERLRVENERKEKEAEKRKGELGVLEMPENVVKCIKRRKEALDMAESFRKSDESKPVRKKLRKRILKAVNQISLSQRSVSEKTIELMAILQEASRLSGSAQAWAATTVVDQLVGCSETTVALSPAAAFSVGHVINNLTKRVPELKDIFFAEFCLSCPFCAPVYPKKQANETKEQFKRRLGFNEDEEGSMYLERMSGYVSLYSALLQMGTFGESTAWEWFKKMVGGRPGKMTAPMLAAFLEVAGYEMVRHYGVRFEALLQLMLDRVGPGKIPGARPGPANRLERWCEAYAKRELKLPKGKELPKQDAENF